MKPKPPGPQGVDAVLSLIEMGRVEPLAFWIRAHSKYGDVIRINLGWTAIWSFASPAAMRDVLITQNKLMRKGIGYSGLKKLLGEGLITTDKQHWSSQRQRLNPVFTPSAINASAGEIYDACLIGTEELKATAGEPQSVDVGQAMKRLTMRVVSKGIFGIDLSERHDEIVDAFDVAFRFVVEISEKPLRAPLFVPTKRNRSFKRALETIDRFIAQLISESNAESSEGLHGRIRQALEENDHVRLRDEVISLYFAGFETTARTMTFLIRVLSDHPEVLRDLRAEAATLTRPASTMSVLQTQPLATEVVNEALRLYPPVAIMARQANQVCNIDGYEVGANNLILICPYIAHRNPSFWPTEGVFAPSLEQPLASRIRHRGAFVPFGAGSRVCLGQNFAMVELVIAISLMAANLDWTLDDTSPLEVDFHGTLRPTAPVFARFTALKRTAVESSS